MESRRSFLKSIAPVAVAVMLPAAAVASQEDPCEFFARCLADAMQSRHGGGWHSEIDHQIGAAYIFKT